MPEILKEGYENQKMNPEGPPVFRSKFACDIVDYEKVRDRRCQFQSEFATDLYSSLTSTQEEYHDTKRETLVARRQNDEYFEESFNSFHTPQQVCKLP